MRAPDSWSKARVAAGIAILTAACWLILGLLGLDGWAAVQGGFVPARYWLPDTASVALFWLTPITTTLVHANFFQLGVNLIFLAVCGRRVENVLGPGSMALLYLLGAYAAAGAQFLVDPHGILFMIGAGGAISAVIGAYATLFGRNRAGALQGRLAVWLNALWLLATWIVIQLLVAIASAAGSFRLIGVEIAITVAALAGGFLVGAILANPLLRFRWRKA